MSDTFFNEFDTLYKQAVEIHELTTTTCDMCGGSYAENLDGAISYFVLDGKRFKLAITRV